MNFMTTGSIYSYTRNLKLSQKWNIKKQNGNFLQKDSSGQSSNAAVSEFEQYREQIEQFQKQNNPDLSTLYSKLRSGKKLSAEELNYLRDNDPVSYQQAKEMDAERESYKRELKQCKTKEDVERLRTNRLAACFAAATSISHNSNIPKLTKMQLMAAECAKAQALEEETRAFKATLNYAHMPTDAEKKEAEKEKTDALKGDTKERMPEKLQKEENIPEDSYTKTDDSPNDDDAPTFTKTDMDFNRLKTETSAVQYHTSYGREVYKQEAAFSEPQNHVSNRRKKS